MHIEPCCAERQIATLLRKATPNAILFQTAGDLTLEHLMKAVFLLSGDRPRTLTLAVPTFTDAMARTINAWLAKGWIATFRLLSNTPAPSPVGRGSASAYARTDAPVTPMLLFEGSKGSVAVQGPIFDKVTPGLHLYAAISGPSGSPLIRAYTDPLNAYIKANTVPSVAMPSQPNDTTEAKSKRKYRKNAKPVQSLATETPAEESAAPAAATTE